MPRPSRVVGVCDLHQNMNTAQYDTEETTRCDTENMWLDTTEGVKNMSDGR